MSTFVLVPGAGGAGWYWHRVVAELQARGHEGIAVDIREDDASLGLPEYADITVAAIGDRAGVVVVAQSMGAFTAPMVAARVALRGLVLLNAMVPLPGETPGEWWAATGQEEARVAADRAAGRDETFDETTHFLHDVPPEIAEAGASEQRGPSDTPFGQRCAFEAWPEIPIEVLVGRDDRFFPADFQRRVARERLGLDVTELGGGHLVALSNPVGLVDRLVDFDARIHV